MNGIDKKPPLFLGPKCDLCSDGYYGDPTAQFGEKKLCQQCDCNENVDPNAVGNCNRTTGECLKCIYNTGGFECESCLPGQQKTFIVRKIFFK